MWRARASTGAVDERAVLLAQADSLFATLEAIGRRDTRISGALDGAKAETARLRSRIRRAPRDQQVLAPLRDSLDRLDLELRAARRRRRARRAADRAHERGRRWPWSKRPMRMARSRDGGGIHGAPARRLARLRHGAGASCATRRDTAPSPSRCSQPAAAKPLRTRALAAQSALNVAILEVPKGSNAGTPPTLATDVGGGLVGQAAVHGGIPIGPSGA